MAKDRPGQKQSRLTEDQARGGGVEQKTEKEPGEKEQEGDGGGQ